MRQFPTKQNIQNAIVHNPSGLLIVAKYNAGPSQRTGATLAECDWIDSNQDVIAVNWMVQKYSFFNPTGDFRLATEAEINYLLNFYKK